MRRTERGFLLKEKNCTNLYCTQIFFLCGIFIWINWSLKFFFFGYTVNWSYFWTLGSGMELHTSSTTISLTINFLVVIFKIMLLFFLDWHAFPVVQSIYMWSVTAFIFSFLFIRPLCQFVSKHLCMRISHSSVLTSLPTDQELNLMCIDCCWLMNHSTTSISHK